MFTYADRLRAVRLYIKCDKLTGLSLRQLGYPAKNALMTWNRQYEQGHELRAGCKRSATS